MWFKKAITLEEIDFIADQISKEKRYDPEKHLNLISDLHKPNKANHFNDSVEDGLESFYASGEPHRIYHEIHPQLYIYPHNKTNEWRYLLFDPKHLKKLENSDYKENLGTGLDLNTNIQEVFDYLHEIYPTATIDMFETEEQMLADE